MHNNLCPFFAPDTRAGGGAPAVESWLSTLTTSGFGVWTSLEAHNRLSCLRLADTALKPQPSTQSFHSWVVRQFGFILVTKMALGQPQVTSSLQRVVCLSEIHVFTKTSGFQTLPFFLSLRLFSLGPDCRPSRFQLSCPRSADTAV